MTPHPDELTALLALPPAVRQALARCAGPGWAVPRDGPPRAIVPAVGVRESIVNVMEHADCGVAWLPADSAEILALCGTSRAPGVVMADDGWEGRLNGQVFYVTPTARLAALRLLAEVSNG